MKNINQTQTILLLAFFLSLPVALISQEEVKEKKVTIKTVKEVDGKKIVKDTTFVVSDDDDIKEIVKEYTMDAEGDSSADVIVDVMVDVDKDVDWESEDGSKVVIIKKGHHDGDADVKVTKKVIVIDGSGSEEHVMVYPHSGTQKVMKFNSEDGTEEEIIMVSPHGQHKVIKWSSEDGEDFEYEFELEMESLNEEMAMLSEEMKNMQIEIIEENGNISTEILELKHLEALEHLGELEHIKNMEVIVLPEHHSRHSSNDFVWRHSGGMEVSDEELRDAGVKNKPDRLELEEINIEKDDGVIDLSFSLKDDGAPKVAVYNVYGDKVFSGKPELMNNEYQIKMDLSKKQYGTYYLQIILGSSSKTMRLNL